MTEPRSLKSIFFLHQLIIKFPVGQKDLNFLLQASQSGPTKALSTCVAQTDVSHWEYATFPAKMN